MRRKSRKKKKQQKIGAKERGRIERGEKEDEDYRERREVKQASRGGGERETILNTSNSHSSSHVSASSLCLCFLHHCLELFSGQCACKLLHGGNFSGFHLLQEGVSVGEKGGCRLCGKGAG